MPAITLPAALRDRLVEQVRKRLPHKSYGFLLSEGDPFNVCDFVFFESNLRTTGSWREQFERYGPYFVEHDNAGFVATPEEAWEIQKSIWARGLVEIGVFHSHIRHPANFSGVDFDLHTERFDNLWHLIVSMRSPDQPQVRAFSVTPTEVAELPVVTPQTPRDGPACDAAVDLLALDTHGRRRSFDSQAIMAAVEYVLRSGNPDAIDEILRRGFLRGSEDRYLEYVAPLMASLPGGGFTMGTPEPHAPQFMGESPPHIVELSPFHLGRVPVTNALYSVFDPDRGPVASAESEKPAVDISWFDATLFALWMGCRLPTEAEWEYACGAGSASDWCSSDAAALPEYAWYSDNSNSQIHPVGTRLPNVFGLFDMHGNIWEWCEDVYDVDFYTAPRPPNPVRRCVGPEVQHVTRGGCMNSFAEMCRTRYRFHEADDFRAADLGFRVARSPKGPYQWSI
ncbi:MAG TPA: SUMF1/EgtB/PvdO family nonheme iron enzyme [Chloroflexota bacterium]|jgi:proteasome lid subunit RPN8/RPN11